VDFAHAKADGAFYRLRIGASPVDEGLDSFLSLAAARDAPPRLGEEVLSLDITCTKRSLPAQLRIGDLRVPTGRSPTVAEFTNLLPVTKPLRPPLGTELHWRLLSHLSINHGSLAEVGTLQALLGLYNFQSQGDYPTARANGLRVSSIRAIRSAPLRRFIGGAPVRGQRTNLELDEAGFASRGDLFIFGWVLDELFSATLTINSFHQLSVSIFPAQLEYKWPPRSGTQPLL
jgi:type VI secretion system protein ImpG